jgi:hypothetical protein
MAAFAGQGVIANKLSSATFTDKVLLFRRFFTVLLYFCTLAIGAIESYFYFHNTKIQLYLLIAIFLQQHTFYITTKYSFV